MENKNNKETIKGTETKNNKGDRLKAPIKVDMDRGVKVPYMVKASDQP